MVLRTGIGERNESDLSRPRMLDSVLSNKQEEENIIRANMEQKVDIMPIMETIPLAWVQITEGATIIDILHTCMLIDTGRDTVKLFNHINRQATEQYQKYFDSSFKPLLLAQEVTEEYMTYFKIAALNNRAVMTQFKIMSHSLSKKVSELENQVILDF